MSKYLAMGMKLDDVIQTATWNAAKAIKHEELGNLSEGSPADVAVIRIRDGKFGYVDAGGNTIEGNKKLEAELTLQKRQYCMGSERNFCKEIQMTNRTNVDEKS